MIKQLKDVHLQMIVAMDEGGGIGYQGMLPWPKNTKDFKFFQEKTKGSIVIMGRKTYEEIAQINQQRGKKDGPLLPNRVSIVISSEEIVSAYEITVEKSLLSAIQYRIEEDDKPVFIIGGLQLYTEALPFVKTLYVTVFKGTYQCDRYLPIKYLTQNFDIVEGTDEKDLYFLKLNRVKNL
jgi:dihydrofolate reductase